MGTHFERWEKDPFFSAAEEVQESADRMESAYRTWIHATKDSSASWNTDELRRDVQTALGTTKWQLEEFESAVKSSYSKNSVDDSKDRHHDFVTAMESQISRVESYLHDSAISAGKPPSPWVRLDEGESAELALFLSGSDVSAERTHEEVLVKDKQTMSQPKEGEQFASGCSETQPKQWGTVEPRDENVSTSGHRRTASASADIGSWSIAVSDDVCPLIPNSQTPRTPRKIPSVSGFLNTMDSMSKKWSKNGYRKLKLVDYHHEAGSKLPESLHVTRGIKTCYEKSKSCLGSCDDCDDKQLYGWYGAFQRQLQRSQYYMQYSQPVQKMLWILGIICFFVVLAICAM